VPAATQVVAFFPFYVIRENYQVDRPTQSARAFGQQDASDALGEPGCQEAGGRPSFKSNVSNDRFRPTFSLRLSISKRGPPHRFAHGADHPLNVGEACPRASGPNRRHRDGHEYSKSQQYQRGDERKPVRKHRGLAPECRHLVILDANCHAPRLWARDLLG